MSGQFAPENLSGQNGGSSARMFGFGSSAAPVSSPVATRPQMMPAGAVPAPSAKDNASIIPSRIKVLKPQLQKRGLYAVMDFSTNTNVSNPDIKPGQKEYVWSAGANADLVAEKLAGPFKKAKIKPANPDIKERRGHLLNELSIMAFYSNCDVGLSLTPCRKDAVPENERRMGGPDYKLTPICETSLIDQAGGDHTYIMLPRDRMSVGSKPIRLFSADLEADKIADAFHLHNVTSVKEVDEMCQRELHGTKSPETAKITDYERKIPQRCGVAIDFVLHSWDQLSSKAPPEADHGYIKIPEVYFQAILSAIGYAVDKQKSRIIDLQDLHLVLRRADGAPFSSFKGPAPHIHVETALALSYYDTADFNRKPDGNESEDQLKSIALPVSMKLNMLVENMMKDNEEAVTRILNDNSIGRA